MAFAEKTLEELYAELSRVEREKDAKGRNHPDYPIAKQMIAALKRAISKKEIRERG